MPSFNTPAVLKTVENVGVSYLKGSDQYSNKLVSELKSLNFPYRPDAVSMFLASEFYNLAVLHLLPVKNKAVS